MGVSRASDASAGVAVLQATGENDAFDADRLQQELAELGGAAVVIDLRRASFVDSTFISALIVAARERPVAIVLPDDAENAVRRVFKLAHLADALPVYDDWDAAVGALDREPAQ
jgi:anti-anti-sigma factor